MERFALSDGLVGSVVFGGEVAPVVFRSEVVEGSVSTF